MHTIIMSSPNYALQKPLPHDKESDYNENLNVMKVNSVCLGGKARRGWEMCTQRDTVHFYVPPALMVQRRTRLDLGSVFRRMFYNVSDVTIK